MVQRWRIVMHKKVIVVNGKGGVGKDTLCDAVNKVYNCRMISSIDPIKQAAKIVGWDGQKDQRSRLFLSDLKRLVTEYNDYTNTYLVEKYEEFMKDDHTDILFVCIREAKSIDKFKASVDTDVDTLLIKRPEIDYDIIGNISDDKVFGYDYDYVFFNSLSLEEERRNFILFISEIVNGTAVDKVN